MTPIDRLGRGRRWARWGLLLTTVALAATLVGSAWTGYRSAADAVDALQRGQAGMLAGAFRGGVFGAWARARGRDPSQASRAPGIPDAQIAATIDSVVADRWEAGVRWAGFLSPDGAIVASGGEEVEGPLGIPSSDERPALVRHDRRVRAYFAPPPDGPAPRLTLVVEFEPVIARAMETNARRSLILAAVVAGLLTLAGLVFWRLTLRVEAAERQLEAQRRLSALGEMSAVLAHEIRNPLASLKGHAQLLVERLAGASDERRKAERVVGEAERLEALTSDLLDFAGSGPLRVEEIDPVELVRSSATEAAPGLAVSVGATGAPTRWPLDARRLGRALVNLIRNAAQASPDDRPPEIEVTTEADRLVVVVRDHGEGLPRGREERIFDPFFTTRTTGTGLGLPVAKRIAELHGGTLAAADAPGGGARFRLEIPRRS